MKTICFILVLIGIVSCTSVAERKHNEEYWKYETRKMQTKYLEDLTRIRSHAEAVIAIRYIDSLYAAIVLEME